MKYLVVLVIGVCYLFPAFAQPHYEISRDGKNKILKGIITKEAIARDTAFPWYQRQREGFVADTAAVRLLKEHGEGIEFVVFAGTWCSDTKFLLPKYFAWLEAAGFPEEKVTLIGVDRRKKTVGHLAEAFGVEYVPTFIVMKNGKEAGRVVEYGKYGVPDKDISEILQSLTR